jgi:Txe/YoeB family toxin of Txe-Axe toxin-antitoxin module
MKEAKRQLGDKAGKNLILRITQLEAFKNLKMVPSSLPWRREKLTNYKDRWSVRIDSNFRLEFIALDLNEDLSLIENIKIVEVSKHYE